MDPPDIAITEGGGNRRKPLSPYPRRVGMYRPTVAPIETVVDKPGIADVVTIPSNRGDVNEEGVTDEMGCYAMGQEKVQDQLNDAEKLDICPVDILSCYWRPEDEKLMLGITGLLGIGEYLMEDDFMRVDYPDDLALLILKLIIGLKKAREKRNFRAAKL